MPLYNRKNMPQVNTQKLSTAIDMVKSKVKVTKTVLLARKLKQSQKELIPSKVKGVAKKYSKPMDMKPLIISKDNYIVDGHHRWAAGLYKFGKEVKLPVFIIQLKKRDIKYIKGFGNFTHVKLEKNKSKILKLISKKIYIRENESHKSLAGFSRISFTTKKNYKYILNVIDKF